MSFNLVSSTLPSTSYILPELLKNISTRELIKLIHKKDQALETRVDELSDSQLTSVLKHSELDKDIFLDFMLSSEQGKNRFADWVYYRGSVLAEGCSDYQLLRIVKEIESCNSVLEAMVKSFSIERLQKTCLSDQEFVKKVIRTKCFSIDTGLDPAKKNGIVSVIPIDQFNDEIFLIFCSTILMHCNKLLKENQIYIFHQTCLKMKKKFSELSSFVEEYINKKSKIFGLDAIFFLCLPSEQKKKLQFNELPLCPKYREKESWSARLCGIKEVLQGEGIALSFNELSYVQLCQIYQKLSDEDLGDFKELFGEHAEKIVREESKKRKGDERREQGGAHFFSSLFPNHSTSKVQKAYHTLELKTGAPFTVVKERWHAFAKKYHPDHNKTPGSEEQFKVYQNAFQVLQEHLSSGAVKKFKSGST